MPDLREDFSILQTERYEYYSGTSRIRYVGKAHPGTAQTSPRWQIYQLTYSGNNVITKEWANGSTEFVHRWSQRGSYPYS